MTTFGPRGWSPGSTSIRRGSVRVKAESYDEEARTVDAVISKGSPVQRIYGTERLEISPAAVNLGRLKNGAGIPVLDSHNQFGIGNALGRIDEAWFSNGALMGRIAFHDTDRGREAEGMVARGEISGVSAGYRVEEWEVKDEDGRTLNPEKDRISFDDNLTYTAKRWELLETSLVTVPADADALIRSAGIILTPEMTRPRADQRCMVRAQCYRRQADAYEKRRDPIRAGRLRRLAEQWESYATCS